MSRFFITGIDTDTGKTVITGLMASWFMKQGISVITQKLVQTGCQGLAEDIVSHRKIMGIEPLQEDLNGTTCPSVFSFPASPHLAASLEKRSIDFNEIKQSTAYLSEKYETLLIEGAGGLAVPLEGTYTILDYLEEEKIPVILVTSPKLGSINHTLLSLEALYNRKIPFTALVYNCFPEGDPFIQADSEKVFRTFLKKYNFPDTIIKVPEIDTSTENRIDFSALLQKQYS